jgi:putative PIN family toxin of toxin-antitoxin system
LTLGGDDGIYAIIASMVIVLDTSVFVSALLGPRGASREVLRVCLGRRLRPLMGTALFSEYESLISRTELFERCHLDAIEREAVLNGFLSVCRWTNIYYGWRPNLRDEGDNHLIELAVAGGAEVVVTNNIRDLRSGELRFPGLRILQPSELLKEIQ